MEWALFLLIFSFNTMTWTYADIDGALVFETQEACVKPMLEYNRLLKNEKYVFVCEPYVAGPTNKKQRNGEEELKELLEKNPDINNNQGTGNDLFKGLGMPEPFVYGQDV
jgi:hypothetical protein